MDGRQVFVVKLYYNYENQGVGRSIRPLGRRNIPQDRRYGARGIELVENRIAYPFRYANKRISETASLDREVFSSKQVDKEHEIARGRYVFMTSYRVRVVVKEVRGYCALGLKPGDEFVIEKFYVLNRRKTGICLHALIGMTSLLLPFLKGASARELGISVDDDIGFVQCPDSGRPYTSGGTVVFELRREKID